MSLNLSLATISQKDFDFMVKNGKRSSTIYGIDFKSLILSTYGYVKFTLPEFIKSGDFDGLILSFIRDRGIVIFDCDLDYIDSNDMMYFVLWVIDELGKVNKMESDNLASQPDIDKIAAGIDELNIFGEMNTIDQLAGGDILKWNEVMKLPYQDVFDKQMMMIKHSAFDKRYSEVLRNKSKKNGRS